MAGDLLRDEVKKGSEAGRRIAEMIKEGKIVPTQARPTNPDPNPDPGPNEPNPNPNPQPQPPTPNPYPDQVTIDLFKEAISSTPGPYLIEGFPRTLESLTT